MNILVIWSNLPLIIIGYYLISFAVQKIPRNLIIGIVGLLGYVIHKIGTYWLGVSGGAFPLLDVAMFNLIQPFGIYSLMYGIKNNRTINIQLGTVVLVGLLLVPLVNTVIPIIENYLIR